MDKAEKMIDFKRLSVNNNTLLRYRDLDYDMWYAISEFIDNSLHSYLANKANLNKLGISKCDTTILIDVDDEGNEFIIVEDNAGGVNPEDFNRLLSIGVPKEKSEFQLSEFGMGMKTASIWLGNLIEIETKHFEEDEAFKITIDISAIGTDEGEVNILKVLDSSLIPGYTKIKISKLNRKVKNKTKKVGISLASIYKKYIESGDINIVFQGEALIPQVYTLERTSDGSKLKKDFKIILSNGKECSGWIGVMQEGKAIKAGFSIYRHNRLVMGYPENSWKPYEVFGEGASARTNKLVGELNMTDFKIAHTKNKINFIDNEEEEFIKQLKENCKDLANENLIRNIGKTFTKKEHEDEPNTKITNSLLNKWASEEKNTNVSELVFVENDSLEENDNYLSNLIKEGIKPITEFPFLQSSNYEMTVRIYEFLDSEQPYLLVNEEDSCLNVFINVGHKFFQDIVRYDTSEQQLTYKLNCIFDAVSETSVMKRKGKVDPNEIRLAKNLFLKRYAEFR